MYDASKIAFIDTETTGLDAAVHHVWEIAVIVDGNEHTWQQRLREPAIRDADPHALALTGFDERYNAAKAVPPPESIDRFSQLVAGRHLVGACPWFDEQRLAMWLAPGSTPTWHYHLIDVEALAVGYLTADDTWSPLLPWDSKDLSRAIGVDPDQFTQHTALGDARWAKAMFEAIMGQPQ